MTEINGSVHRKKHALRPQRSATPDNRKRPGRRFLFVAVGITALAGLTVATVGWLGLKASVINENLSASTRLVPQLKEHVLRDDASEAAVTVLELRTYTTRAREAANDPLWTLAGTLPWVGGNFQAASEVATSADDVAQFAATPLMSVYRSLDWKALTLAGDADLSQVIEAEPKVVGAAQAVRQSLERLNAIDAKQLMPQISGPLLEAREQLDSLRSGLDVAASVVALAPNMMGAEVPRQYLLLIQNNAEARAGGGIPGALAVLRVDNGKLTLGAQTSAAAVGMFSPPLDVDMTQEQIYSSRLGKYVQDVNLTPDFPTTARTAQAMWERKTGERLDGVVSTDPVALSYILDATGPVSLADPQLRLGALPTQLSGKNVVRTLLSDVYAEVQNPSMQDQYFAGAAKEIFGAISAGVSEPRKLLEVLGRSATEGRIRLWSASADEQAVLTKYSLGGAISGPSVAPAQFGVYFNDGTGAKMDYYVKRSVQLVQECTGDDYGQVKVRITSTNTAPADAATSLPAYVTGGGVFGVPPGTVQTNVIAYGPVQANVETAHVDGKKVSFAANRHANRPVGTVTVTLTPGQSSTVDVTFGKIVQHTEPDLVVTPTVQAIKEVVLATEPAVCVPEK